MDPENVNAADQKTVKRVAHVRVSANVAAATVTLEIVANRRQIVVSTPRTPNAVDKVRRENHQKNGLARIVFENQSNKLNQMLMKRRHQESDVPVLIVIKMLSRHNKSL